MTMTARPTGASVRFRQLGWVVVGGTVGTATRLGLTEVIPGAGAFPVAIFSINVVGAFLLGWLLEALTRSGTNPGRRRAIRLLLGTGFCGGFTTYSALVTDVAVLSSAGDGVTAVVYAGATLVVGALATWAGIALGGRFPKRPVGAHPGPP